ncbi:MAG: 23S rRNA (uracil(1939)-C(5))-methyltransferase RlmD [Pseudomonadota bacterium]
MNGLQRITIERLVHGGKGLGRIDGQVVFVPDTIPGEVVEVRLGLQKKGYREAILEKIVSPSPMRTAPQCRHFGACGGCQWQHISYEGQVRFKEEIFRETLTRIGRVKCDILPVLSCPVPFGYRNRVRFQARSGTIGFFSKGSHEIIGIESCLLAHPLVRLIHEELIGILSPAATRQLTGLEIAVSEEEGKGIATLLVEGQFTNLAAIGSDGISNVSHIKGLCVRESTSFSGKTGVLLEGSLRYSCRLAGGRIVRYLLCPGVFSQVNPVQNEALIATVMKWADVSRDDSVLDLFCGMGNIALPLAPQVREVTGIERNTLSIKNALLNAAENGIKNTVFLEEEVESGLDKLIKAGKKLDLVIMDPPRSGCAGIIDKISGLQPARIIYISCDPATLARDAAHLNRAGFIPVQSQPLDMFPQTYHIESVTLFRRK